MPAHLVLLFELDRTSEEIEPSIASELERAGYEVTEAHDLSTASASLFVNRRVEAVVIDVPRGQILPELADSLSAIRPGVPLLRRTSTEVQAPADRQARHAWAMVISTLNELLGQRAA
jgi:DNA-binding response OmpR family regulator